DPTTFGRTRLSFADTAEIDEFVATLERFERGELAPDKWRAFRLVRGTYGQRQTADAQMLRVKIPQGVLTADQLAALADVGEWYSRGFRVTVGGGTAILVTSGGLLHEFLPASELFRVAEAVLRVFHRLGDYEHKQRNRMKFLIRAIGWTRWREEYERELTLCRLTGKVPTLDL